jgi:cell division protease FtsH
MNPNYRNLALWAIIAVLLIALFNLFQSPQQRGQVREVPYSEFLQEVESGRVNSVTISGDRITGTYTDSATGFQTYSPGDANLVQRLENRNVTINARPDTEGQNSIFGYLISWLPMLLILAVWIFFMRQMQSGSGRAMGFGKSKAKLLTEAHGRVTFADVAGVDEAKQDLEEIVEFLRDPQKFAAPGRQDPARRAARRPARHRQDADSPSAVAGEAEVPFFSISGSDFVEMFVGVGASRVRDLFEQAREERSPCIVFIDEIDAVGRQRGAGIGGGHDEREQTLNQILVEMDGFDSNKGIILIAATNRPDVLDPALLRPGRFDRQVVIAAPDIVGREAILKVHVQEGAAGPQGRPDQTIAQGTAGLLRCRSRGLDQRSGPDGGPMRNKRLRRPCRSSRKAKRQGRDGAGATLHRA